MNNSLIRFFSSQKLSPMANQWFTKPLAYAYATHSTSPGFGDTVCGLNVPAVILPGKTPYLASPSLHWVAWASLPQFLRYYAPLRLPSAFLGSLRFSLSLPNTLAGKQLGSLEFPSYLFRYMPCSQTPVVSCHLALQTCCACLRQDWPIRFSPFPLRVPH